MCRDILTLLRAFENRRQLPIDPYEVRDYILSNGLGKAGEIEGVSVDLQGYNVNAIFLLTSGWDRPINYDGKYRALIFINKNSKDHWKRFGFVKEMMHVFDKNENNDKAKIDMIRSLSVPEDVRHVVFPRDDDDRAIFPALAICAPKVVREELRRKYLTLDEEDRLKLIDSFCEKAYIPKRYKYMIISPEFDEELMNQMEYYI